MLPSIGSTLDSDRQCIACMTCMYICYIRYTSSIYIKHMSNFHNVSVKTILWHVMQKTEAIFNHLDGEYCLLNTSLSFLENIHCFSLIGCNNSTSQKAHSQWGKKHKLINSWKHMGATQCCSYQCLVAKVPGHQSLQCCPNTYYIGPVS